MDTSLSSRASADARSSERFARKRGALARIDRALGSGPSLPALMFAIALFGVWLRHESLSAGFFADDYAQLGMLDGKYPLERAPYDLFTFSDGSQAEGDTLIRTGFYPWWADPTVRVSMFRPLASLMTWLDFKLFGNDALGYHLHSLAWWLALVALAGALYRAWLGPTQAAIAFALYVCDESHGIALGWNCNRAAIISTLFSLLATRAYVTYCEQSQRRHLVSAACYYALALGFGEYALCGLGYILAYEGLRGTGRVVKRLWRLLPICALAGAYLIARLVTGMSMQRSGLYVDALTEPYAFSLALLQRFPVFVGDMLFGISADHWTWGSPGLAHVIGLKLLGDRWQSDPSLWRVAQTLLGALGCLMLFWWLRRRPHGGSVFWLCVGSLLSLIPVCGSFPSSRLTLVAAFGFMPTLADLLASALSSTRTTRRRGRVTAAAATLFLAYHALHSIWFEREEAYRIKELTRRVRTAILDLDVDDKNLSDKTLVLMAAPEVGTSMYLPLTRLRYARAAPRSVFYLSLTPAAYTLARASADTFTIRFMNEATALQTPHEQLLRNPSRSFHPGDVVNAGPARVTILELQQGRPKLVRFRFDRKLEDPSLVFMTLTPAGYRRFSLPQVGRVAIVRAPELPNPRARVTPSSRKDRRP